MTRTLVLAVGLLTLALAACTGGNRDRGGQANPSSVNSPSANESPDAQASP